MDGDTIIKSDLAEYLVRFLGIRLNMFPLHAGTTVVSQTPKADLRLPSLEKEGNESRLWREKGEFESPNLSQLHQNTVFYLWLGLSNSPSASGHPSFSKEGSFYPFRIFESTP